MFSSSHDPYPVIPSPALHFSPQSPFASHDSVDIYLHRDLLAADDAPPPPPPPPPPLPETANNNIVHDCDVLDFMPSRKRGTRKDRHSKICTSQGPRDRRVRLSIEIAQKFFNLQDMLGFEKASKTLDWLLTKSNKAIKELEQLKKKKKTIMSSSTSNNIEKDLEGKEILVGLLLSNNRTSSSSSSHDLLARELREKARARARERTLEKMCIRKQLSGDESKKFLDYSRSYSLPNNQSTTTWSHIQIFNHGKFEEEDFIINQRMPSSLPVVVNEAATREDTTTVEDSVVSGYPLQDMFSGSSCYSSNV